MRKIFSKSKNKRTIKTQRGFTLIELMVSTSIFMMVMLVAVGSLLVTSDLAKKSYTLNFTMDNLSFAIESMSRSLRMGTNYTCTSDGINIEGVPLPQDCKNGGNLIAFIPARDAIDSRKAYKLHERNDGTHTIQRCNTLQGGGYNCVNMISNNINIDILRFFVRGADSSEYLTQPSVYMIIRGSVTNKGEETSFAIQTMVSQRTSE